MPDFLIIGAARSGTSWLHSCLDQHPQIFMPAQSVHYFSRKFDDPAYDSAWYDALFDPAQSGQIVGERSSSYLNDQSAASRISATIPNVKIVVLLRNPVERVYSNYCQGIARGIVSRDIDSYLNPEFSRLPRILEGGLYSRHLARYFDLFPRENILGIKFDDLKANSVRSLEKVCEFLTVSSKAAHELDKNQSNPRPTEGVSPMLKRVLWPVLESEKSKTFLNKVNKNWVWRFGRRLVSGPIKYPPLTPELKRKLADYYHSDISRTSEILGQDFVSWRN